MTEQQERLANEIRNTLNTFNENVNKILEEMFSFESKTEKDWEIKYPYKNNDGCFILFDDGDTALSYWAGDLEDVSRFRMGNVFPTLEAAELEAERRILLTRFNAFRDECNGDWKAAWNDFTQKKYYVFYSESKNDVCVTYIVFDKRFHTFGYFKNGDDAYKAIELFGDKIKELFVECE